MATYDQLPVYKKAYDFLLDVYKMCQNMERDYKFSIGEDLKKEVRQLLKNVYHANRVEDKLGFILAARENVEDIRLSLRVLHDLQKIQTPQFVDRNEKLEDVSKQLAAWYKHKKQNTSSTAVDEESKKRLKGESRGGGFEKDLFSESAD